ncbi:MAG: glycosyltransferase [Patescibacteria group bacterium]|nr:glycosyltransferase [Patescibacteria group bacterium]MDD5490845.1 glycosyltransferase [Patescibacteria group bacterium]
MNILIFKFPYSSQFGGGEKHTIALTEKLKDRGINFYLVSSCSVLVPEFKHRDWPVLKLWAGVEPVAVWSLLLFPFFAPFIFLELFLVLLYYRFFKKIKILYCLSLTEKVLMTPWARLLGIRVVWVEHTSIGRWLRFNPLRLLFILWAPLAKIITVSYAVEKQIRKLGVRAKQVRVIYNGIDLDVCPFSPAVRNYRDHFTVGTICRLSREKGVEYLLQAMAIAKEFIPTLRLVVVGDGPERQRLMWLTRQLSIENSVLFVGFQQEFEKWISGFDIFVLPSVKKESFGMVSLYAMACGKPVVATRVGGIPEVVDAGKSGILVEPKNAEVMAQAIINLHRHPEWRREMGFYGRKAVEERFSEEKMLGEYQRLFHQLAERI